MLKIIVGVAIIMLCIWLEMYVVMVIGWLLVFIGLDEV